MDPPRPPQRLLDEPSGRYRGSQSRRMPTSSAPPPAAAAPPPAAAAPPDEEEDDDFDWSDHGEEGGGPQMQEAIEASLQSVGDDRVQRARTSCQLKAKEASELAWALKDSSSMDLALRRKRARENQKRAANGAGSSRRSP